MKDCNCGGSNLYWLELLKNKKASINQKNNDDMCFEYGIAAALNQENLEKDPEIIEKIRPFLDQYD